MAQTALEIWFKARDDATRVITRIGDASARASTWVKNNWVQTTVALTAASAAIETLGRTQRKQRVEMTRLAQMTGRTKWEFNSLARSLSTVSSPMSDVLTLMELAVKQGLTSDEAITQYATLWDMVAQATDESAVSLAESAVGLKAMGITASEQGKSLDALGFILLNSTGTVGEFLSSVGRIAPQLKEMGLTVDDTAAIMVILEKEMGLTGRTARSEFMQAMSSSHENVNVLLATLDISQETFEEYRAKIEGSSTALRDSAAASEESFTWMQRLQHGTGELFTANQNLIISVSQVAVGLAAIGPIAKGIQLAFSALPAVLKVLRVFHVLTAAIGAVNVAFTFLAANPIVLIIAAIVAAIALISVGLFLLIKNWDSVWSAISNTVSAVWGFISDLFTSKWGWFLPGGVLVKAILWIKDNWGAIWGGIKSVASAVWGSISGLFSSSFGWLLPGGALVKAILWIKDNWKTAWDSITGVIQTSWGIIKGVASSIVGVIATVWNTIIDKINSLPSITLPSFLGGASFGIPTLPRIDVPSFGSGGTAPGSVAGSPMRQMANALIGRIPSFATGGVVGGPIGSPSLAVVHGGETISPVGRSTINIETLVIHASTEDGGRQAARAFVEQLRHLEYTGQISRITR